MSKTDQDFMIYRGESRTIGVDLGGFDPTQATKIEWRIAHTPNAADADTLVTKSIGDGLAIDGNTVIITLDGDDTKDLLPGFYYHEMKLFLTDSKKVVAMTGTAVINPALDMAPAVVV